MQSVCSGEEAHVCSTHAVVGVPYARKHPLRPGLAATIRTEEVEEDCCIERSDSLLSEIIVVGLDFGASVIVRALNLGCDQLRVVL